METLQGQWHDTLSVWGLSELEKQKEWQALVDAYSEPQRVYHTLHHIASIFLDLQHFFPQTIPLELEMAVWYHDAIYDPLASDNEEKSAEWAVRSLTHWGVSPELVKNVEQLILSTKTHESSSDNPLQNILLDVDLGILGGNSELYAWYAGAIRQEFQWAPRELYAQGRSQVLQSFLDKAPLYLTDWMKQREEQAKRNLQWELELWKEEGFDFAEEEP